MASIPKHRRQIGYNGRRQIATLHIWREGEGQDFSWIRSWRQWRWRPKRIVLPRLWAWTILLWYCKLLNYIFPSKTHTNTIILGFLVKQFIQESHICKRLPPWPTDQMDWYWLPSEKNFKSCVPWNLNYNFISDINSLFYTSNAKRFGWQHSHYHSNLPNDKSSC